jgi:hypothetical protein
MSWSLASGELVVSWDELAWLLAVVSWLLAVASWLLTNGELVAN